MERWGTREAEWWGDEARHLRGSVGQSSGLGLGLRRQIPLVTGNAVEGDIAKVHNGYIKDNCERLICVCNCQFNSKHGSVG